MLKFSLHYLDFRRLRQLHPPTLFRGPWLRAHISGITNILSSSEFLLGHPCRNYDPVTRCLASAAFRNVTLPSTRAPPPRSPILPTYTASTTWVMMLSALLPAQYAAWPPWPWCSSLWVGTQSNLGESLPATPGSKGLFWPMVWGDTVHHGGKTVVTNCSVAVGICSCYLLIYHYTRKQTCFHENKQHIITLKYIV
jgi:hypothetical protein